MHTIKPYLKIATLALLALALLLLNLTGGLNAQDQLWTNAAGGNFSDAANWGTDVPDSSENARFDIAAAYEVNLTADHTIAGFFLDQGTVTMSGGFALTVQQPSNFYDGTFNLSGSGTQFIHAGEFAVGRDGGNANLNVLSGAILSTEVGRIGYTNDATGSMTIDGPGSQWQVSTNVIVGRQGAGNLTIQNGGGATLGNGLAAGFAGVTGNVLVTGSGSTLISSANSSQIGNGGTGSLTIADGGSSTFSSMTVGNGAAGHGTVLVDGAGSSWTNTGSTFIGSSGTGLVEIRNGGVATAGSILSLGTSAGGNGTININNGGELESHLSRIGLADGSTGEVKVSGLDSRWNVTNQLFVGRSGTGTLSIDDGARTTVSDFIRIASSSGSTGTINLTDAGSELVSNGLDVGYQGSGSLNLSGGALITTNSTDIGAISGGVGSVVVEGIGTRWNNSGTFDVGAAGTGSMTVSSGGIVSSGEVVVSQSAGSDGTLRVTDSGTQVLTDAIVVGGSSTGVLNIENGGLIHNTGYAGLGNSGTAIVTGNGSQWINDGQVNIWGDLIVEQGGAFTSAVTQLGPSGANASAIVRGTGSVWNSEFGVSIGRIGNGSLEISDGGQVSNLSTSLGANDGSGTLFVRDAGSRLTTSSIAVGTDGDGVAVVENGGQIVSSSVFVYSNGSGSTSIATIQGTGSSLSTGVLFVGESTTQSGNLIVQDNGSVLVAGAANLAQLGVLTLDQADFSAGSFQNSGQVLVTGNSTLSGGMNLMSTGRLETASDATTLINGNVDHEGLEVRTQSGGITRFANDVSGSGSFTGLGKVEFAGAYGPGSSPSVIGFEGSVEFLNSSLLAIELGGLESGEFDQLLIEGDLSLSGDLSVSLINGFELEDNMQFMIADVGGVLTGQFDGYDEGSLIGSYGGYDLFISYSSGTGNDIGLFTTSAVPEPGTPAFLVLAAILAGLRRRRSN